MSRSIRQLFATIGLAAGLLAAPLGQQVHAADIRPQGFLERGVIEWTPEGMAFWPDSQRMQRGGRWFRLEGSEMSIFYGLGGNPSTDWIWPTYTVTPNVWEIVNASPGGLNYLQRYQDAASYNTGFARAGMIVLVGGVGSLLGGLIYNIILGTQNSPREVNPIWYAASGGVAATGLLVYGGAAAGNAASEALLDSAIDAYNREMAGRRQRGPTLNPYSPPMQDFRAPGLNTQ